MIEFREHICNVPCLFLDIRLLCGVVMLVGFMETKIVILFERFSKAFVYVSFLYSRLSMCLALLCSSRCGVMRYSLQFLVAGLDIKFLSTIGSHYCEVLIAVPRRRG